MKPIARVLALLLFAAGPAAAAPGPQVLASGVTGFVVAGTQDVGTFDGVRYTRTWGTVSGVVGPTERVAGLAALPKNAAGAVEYTSQFEIIAPAIGANTTVVVDAENRGSPLVLDSADALAIRGTPASATYPVGLGNGFLQRHHTSYARVQWETHIAAGVPASAQGIGEVIVRDFARALAGDRATFAAKPGFDPGHYSTLVLAGISQSAWFVNTFLAEGFNVDPVTGRGVFGGALAIDGTGNWLALNQLGAAAHAPQSAYVVANGAPLAANALLSRPASDPFYIDVANYTDFYRVRASLTDTAALPANMRRYDWPGAHHPVVSAADAASTFAASRPGGACNGGAVIPLNPVPYNAYLRTLLLELERRIGAPVPGEIPALPPTTLFDLHAVSADAQGVNPLPGAVLKVPVTDADAQPLGGVRFPDADVPYGKPVPISVPPVVTDSITAICGNIGGWQPFSSAEMAKRYGSEAAYVARYAQSLDQLVVRGYLLASEKPELLELAAARYRNPAGY